MGQIGPDNVGDLVAVFPDGHPEVAGVREPR